LGISTINLNARINVRAKTLMTVGEGGKRGEEGRRGEKRGEGRGKRERR
jgi:hypothetical protein